MNLSGVSLRDFEYAVAVAELGNFGKAAERCNVAQPSLSVSVSKLEKRLKTVIFERTTRRVIVTSEGQRVIDQMREILLATKTLFDMTGEMTEPFSGSLRLSAITTLGPYFFPRVLQGLRARYPSLSLVLGEGHTEHLLASLLHGELDAVLMSMPVDDPRLTAIPLFREPFVLACPTGHPAAGLGGNGWVGLPANQRLLLEEGHCLRDQALAACAEGDASTRHATSLETLKYMVAAGEGCTLLPSLAVTTITGVQYSLLRGDEFARTIGLVWRRSDPRGAEFTQFADSLKQTPPSSSS